MRSERGQVDGACNIGLLRCLMPVPPCPGMQLQALLMCGWWCCSCCMHRMFWLIVQVPGAWGLLSIPFCLAAQLRSWVSLYPSQPQSKLYGKGGFEGSVFCRAMPCRRSCGTEVH